MEQFFKALTHHTQPEPRKPKACCSLVSGRGVHSSEGQSRGDSGDPWACAGHRWSCLCEILKAGWFSCWFMQKTKQSQKWKKGTVSLDWVRSKVIVTEVLFLEVRAWKGWSVLYSLQTRQGVFFRGNQEIWQEIWISCRDGCRIPPTRTAQYWMKKSCTQLCHTQQETCISNDIILPLFLLPPQSFLEYQMPLSAF